MKEKQKRVSGLALQLERWLEWNFEIPGTNIRFGLDALIGLVPVVGDFITFIMSSVIVAQAYKDRIPAWTIVRMIVNIGIDSLIGAMPIIGDFADVFWRSNSKNIALWKKATNSVGHSKKDKWIVLAGAFVLLFIMLASIYGSIMLIAKILG
ncbi:DUF4112 domain-containing protein [Oligoflexaceae bacterium]|nr:DUF4112 domain-containing protein [Oligoflexaceae bacterium]